MKKIIPILFVFLTMLGACSEDKVSVSVTGVSLNVATLELKVGETAVLLVSVTPADAENPSVTWTSSNPSAVTVDAFGKVSAVSVGTAVVTVKTTDGGFTATCSITVAAKEEPEPDPDPEPIPVTGVTLNTTATNFNETDQVYELYEGEEMTFTATVAPDNANNKNITWECHDKDDDGTHDSTVISVTGGKVKALRAGSAYILVKTMDGNFTARADIRVKQKGNMGVETEPGGNTGGGGIEW